MLNFFFGVYGIDLGAWSTPNKSMGFDTVVYTVPSWSVSLDIAVMVIITGIIAAIYPAMKALRLKPADAIRIDM